jgi:hypothetical protein
MTVKHCLRNCFKPSVLELFLLTFKKEHSYIFLSGYKKSVAAIKIFFERSGIDFIKIRCIT